jgi:hypothetical protein
MDLFGPVDEAEGKQPPSEEIQLFAAEEIAEASAVKTEETGLYGPIE